MRVLIITSSTGGGHDMRARSFKLWAEKLTDWDLQIHQALESAHPLNAFGVGLYNWIQRHQPRLHHIYFKYLELANMHRKANRMFGANRFRKLVRDYRPDRIVSTHGHLNHGYFDLAREELGDHARCVTICTEFNGGYGFSKHWVNPNADLFIGSTHEAVDAAIELGMPAEKTFCGGFLLRPVFHQSPLSDADIKRFLKTELELDPNAFTILLATGAVGANNHFKLLHSLRKRGKPIQVVALCGKNETTREKLRSWNESAGTIKVKPLAYWEDMSSLLQSVSAVVTRPGAGTLSECILSNVPIIFNAIGGIMPQESLNVRYGELHGISRLMRKPRDLGMILDDWERDPKQVATLRENLKCCEPEKHPQEIINRVNEA